MSAQKFSLELGSSQSFHFEMIGNKSAGKAPKLVNSYDVPIITKVLSSEELLQLWETNVLIQQLFPIVEGRIIPLIDGSNHVKAISVLSQVDIETVKMLIQHLVHYRLVKLIDLFKFSNIYIATPRLAKLAHSPSKQNKYKEFLKANVALSDASL